MTALKTAKFIRYLDDWRGKAALYKVDPPVKYEKVWPGKVRQTSFVVVSAVIAPYTGPEVLIFPCKSNAYVITYLEVGGLRGTLDHKEALEAEGYTVV